MVVDGRTSKRNIFTEKSWMERLPSATYLQKGPRWDWVSSDNGLQVQYSTTHQGSFSDRQVTQGLCKDRSGIASVIPRNNSVTSLGPIVSFPLFVSIIPIYLSTWSFQFLQAQFITSLACQCQLVFHHHHV